MRGHDECFMLYFSDARRTGATRDVNTIVNSLCLDAPAIVCCVVEAPLRFVFSRENLPIFTRPFSRKFRICLGKWQDNATIFPQSRAAYISFTIFTKTDIFSKCILRTFKKRTKKVIHMLTKWYNYELLFFFVIKECSMRPSLSNSESFACKYQSRWCSVSISRRISCRISRLR